MIRIYAVTLQRFRIKQNCSASPSPQEFFQGWVFVLGWGGTVAANILVKSRRCDVLQKTDGLPGAARIGKPGVLIETAAEEASSLLYSFVCLYTTELSGLAALLKSENGFPIHSELYLGSNELLLRKSSGGSLLIVFWRLYHTWRKLCENRVSASGRIWRTAPALTPTPALWKPGPATQGVLINNYRKWRDDRKWTRLPWKLYVGFWSCLFQTYLKTVLSFQGAKFPPSVIYKCLFPCKNQNVNQHQARLTSHCLVLREKKEEQK